MNTKLYNQELTTLEALDFTTRETYLEWRSEWRRTYRELSASIRADKAEMRKGGDASMAQSSREAGRKLAHWAMEIRVASKEKSGAARQARLTVAA